VAELVIFDCDGVLVDSDRISLRIQAEWISALGLEMTSEDCVRDFLGLGMEATLGILAVLPTCVASSGSHEKMRFTLGLTDPWDRFAGRIFSVEEVQRGKPAPDLFLHAAGCMSTPPEPVHRGRGQPLRRGWRQGSWNGRARLRGRDSALTPQRCRRSLHNDDGPTGTGRGY
jgi:beta-phosphoglucomutase-like phosphatase (HAD superfamily)